MSQIVRQVSQELLERRNLACSNDICICTSMTYTYPLDTSQPDNLILNAWSTHTYITMYMDALVNGYDMATTYKIHVHGCTYEWTIM
eukprot:665181-Amorphochlora_amoeboformis.AAC.1